MKQRVITCTQANHKEMVEAVKAWPDLHAMVQHLQSQDLFPGLRAMRITLTGDDQLLAQGLGAISTINATKAV